MFQLGASGADSIGEVLGNREELEKKKATLGVDERSHAQSTKYRAIATSAADLPGIPAKPVRVSSQEILG